MLCSICLDPFESPVVTPCGHVFCLDCLISSCRKSPDATKAPCPSCRTSFTLLTPNAIFVPEKYRQFIDSSVRRLFLDSSGETELQERVAQLEARVKSLESQKDQLMNKCESYMTAATRHAEKEREMRTRCTQLQNELKQANEAVGGLVDREAGGSVVKCIKCAEMSAVVSHPNPIDSTRVTDNSDSSVGSLSSIGALPKGEKRDSGILNQASPVHSHRLTIPLPKRRRMTTHGIHVPF